jgi:hypothetical protein
MQHLIDDAYASNNNIYCIKKTWQNNTILSHPFLNLHYTYYMFHIARDHLSTSTNIHCTSRELTAISKSIRIWGKK